ncbi:MAG: alpha/beta hydrolase [Pseudomonadota bacterium]
MRTAKRLLIGFGLLLSLALAVVAASVLFALDWDRTHSGETANLSFYEDGMQDGLYQVEANGLIFRARIFGASNEGPGVIMLHGHPETSKMWEPLAKAVAMQGYRVIAFDQRGYSPGARPEGIAAYRADNQVADVLAVADVMGFEQFHLVGHDWGAVIAWSTAILEPERLSSLTAMSIPHPQALKTMVVEDTPAYIDLFLLPWLPEAILLFNGMSGYHDTYSEQSDSEIEEYIKVFSEPGASTAALNWYRSIQDSLSLIESDDPRTCVPTLFLYGDQEFWVTPEYLETQQSLISGDYRELELDAGHWLIQRHPEIVISNVLDQLAKSADLSSTRQPASC